MLMYTSCGWFFDELSGIETVQVIQYAARVIQLANEIFGQDFEPQFLERLEKAKSNIPEHGDGRNIYQKFVKPAMIDWQKAAAHYAISSMFQEYGKTTRVFSFTFEDEHREFHVTGKTKLAIGRVRITSEITQETRDAFVRNSVHGRTQSDRRRLQIRFAGGGSGRGEGNCGRVPDRGFSAGHPAASTNILAARRTP